MRMRSRVDHVRLVSRGMCRERAIPVYRWRGWSGTGEPLRGTPHRLRAARRLRGTLTPSSASLPGIRILGTTVDPAPNGDGPAGMMAPRRRAPRPDPRWPSAAGLAADRCPGLLDRAQDPARAA